MEIFQKVQLIFGSLVLTYLNCYGYRDFLDALPAQKYYQQIEVLLLGLFCFSVKSIICNSLPYFTVQCCKYVESDQIKAYHANNFRSVNRDHVSVANLRKKHSHKIKRVHVRAQAEGTIVAINICPRYFKDISLQESQTNIDASQKVEKNHNKYREQDRGGKEFHFNLSLFFHVKVFSQEIVDKIFHSEQLNQPQTFEINRFVGVVSECPVDVDRQDIKNKLPSQVPLGNGLNSMLIEPSRLNFVGGEKAQKYVHCLEDVNSYVDLVGVPPFFDVAIFECNSARK